MIWGPVEGKDSHSLGKVNKGRLLSQIPLYLLFVLGICRVTAFFMGLPDGRGLQFWNPDGRWKRGGPWPSSRTEAFTFS